MPNVKNYVLLETITVGAAGASSVTFNNIPQTGYTDLKIVHSTRCTRSSTTDLLRVQFNGSSTGYSNRHLQGDGSNASSGTASYIWAYQANGATSTANTFGNGEIYIPNYTSSNNKSVSCDGVQETNATAAYMGLTANLWSNTAAITSITLSLDSGSSFVQYSTFSLYGLAAVGTTPTIAPKAAGGDIIQTDGTYWYHAFITSGTFTPAKALSADILCVAGGGGGGSRFGGGGGAGGLLYLSAQALNNAQNYTVTIGSGGSGGTAPNVNGTKGTNGSDSQFGSLTAAVGGGAGGGYDGVGNGGSGGGGSALTSVGAGTPNAGGTATSGQGYAGGSGSNNGNPTQPIPTGWYSGGGGGGATAVGTNGDSSNNGGTGGAGSSTYSSWLTLTAGGSGGVLAKGANGGNFYAQTAGTAGAVNSGFGGGGSGGSSNNGAAGGSGIIIVRYAITA